MSIKAAKAIISNIEPNEEVMMKSMMASPGLFAAHKAFDLVKEGMTFRDAYRQIGSNIKDIKINEDEIVELLKLSTHQGGTGNLQLDKLEEQIESMR
jgi:argininosuccinate lyase